MDEATYMIMGGTTYMKTLIIQTGYLYIILVYKTV